MVVSGQAEHRAGIILTIETLALHAWPAEEVEMVGGWHLRHTRGVTRRANAVWPNGADEVVSLDRKVALVEAFYAERGLPARYQICPAAQPADLDAVLAGRGYVAGARTTVQTAPLAAVLANTSTRLTIPVAITATLSEAWWAAYAAVEGGRWGEREARVLRALLTRIAPPRAFAVLTVDGHPVASGLGVVEEEWLGLFSLATVEAWRRRGAATAVLHALASWALDRNAQNVYLQVMRDNAPALALYARLGFTPLYEYVYRERDLGSRSPAEGGDNEKEWTR